MILTNATPVKCGTGRRSRYFSCLFQRSLSRLTKVSPRCVYVWRQMIARAVVLMRHWRSTFKDTKDCLPVDIANPVFCSFFRIWIIGTDGCSFQKEGQIQ